MTRLTLLLLATPLAGCVTGNDRDYVGSMNDPGSRLVLPAISAAADRVESRQAADPPSLSGLSRANWDRKAVFLPVDGTHATRAYAREHFSAQATNRARGGPVSIGTALEQEDPRFWARVGEASAAPLWAFYDFIALPVRLCTANPAGEVRSMPRSYWRMPPSIPRSIENPARSTP